MLKSSNYVSGTGMAYAYRIPCFRMYAVMLRMWAVHSGVLSGDRGLYGAFCAQYMPLGRGFLAWPVVAGVLLWGVPTPWCRLQMETLLETG